MDITVKCLSEAVKDEIVAHYNNKAKVKDLAIAFDTSTRTIGRVLEERGLSTPVPRLKGEAYQIMKLLKTVGLSCPVDLQTHLEVSAFTPENIQAHLNRCTKEQLASYFYTSGLVKLTEDSKQQHAARKQQQAALFCPPQQSALFDFASA
jgi:hypothetical protein